jgi:hypothetical protein
LLTAQPLIVAAQTPPTSAHPTDTATTTYDLASFSAELGLLSKTLAGKPSDNQLVEMRDSLPKHWVVATPDGNYTIDTQPLRNQLAGLSAASAKRWIDNLALEIKKPEVEDTPETASARSALDAILNRKEFADVGPPSAIDLWRARLAGWFERLMFLLFSAMGRHPIAGEIFFWMLLLTGVMAIAVVLFGFLADRDRVHALPPSSPVGVSGSWQEWLFAAREAAKREDFREAVHCAYWAGIVRLDDTGVVPSDRSKTPREYLRLASRNASTVIAPATQGKSLAELTSGLERVWYAKGEARAQDFRDSLRHLEALGCPLD